MLQNLPALVNPAHLLATGTMSRPDSDVSPPLESAPIMSETPNPGASSLSYKLLTRPRVFLSRVDSLSFGFRKRLI